MCGSATLTMVASSTTIRSAVAMTNRARPPAGAGRRPGRYDRLLRPPSWSSIVFRALLLHSPVHVPGFEILGSGPSWLGRVRVEPAHRDQAQPKVPDLRQDPVQRGLIGQRSRDDRLRAIIGDLETGEPVRPPVIEDAFDAELVAGRPPGAAHTRSPSAQAAGAWAGPRRCW